MNALPQRLRPRIRSRLLWWFTSAIVLALCLVHLLALLQQQRLIRQRMERIAGRPGAPDRHQQPGGV